MASEMLYKLNAFFHFLPEFHVPIDAGRDNEIGFCGDNMRDHIAMHVTLLVAFAVGQILQI